MEAAFLPPLTLRTHRPPELAALVELRDEALDAAGAAGLSADQTKAFDDGVEAFGAAAAIHPPATAATLATLIADRLRAFATAPAAGPQPAPGPHALAAGAAAAAARLPTPQALHAEIAAANRLGWVFVVAVTVLAGSYILVLVPGFGTATDLLACLLWGVGLPAGTHLSSSTTGSIAKTFNVAS